MVSRFVSKEPRYLSPNALNDSSNFGFQRTNEKTYNVLGEKIEELSFRKKCVNIFPNKKQFNDVVTSGGVAQW